MTCAQPAQEVTSFGVDITEPTAQMSMEDLYHWQHYGLAAVSGLSVTGLL